MVLGNLRHAHPHASAPSLGIELNDNPEGRGGRVRMRVPQVPQDNGPQGSTTPEGKPSARDEKGAARTAPPIAEMQS